MNNKLKKLKEEVDGKIGNINTTQEYINKQISALKKQYLILENKKEEIKLEEKKLKLKIVGQHEEIRENFRRRVMCEKQRNVDKINNEHFI